MGNDAIARKRQFAGKVAYGIALALLFGWAAWRRFSLPLEPISDPDTWGYLSPALNKITGGEFVRQGRNFLYPGFLFLVLRFFGDFRFITIAQHLLGLGAGGLLLLTWQRARHFVATAHIPASVHCSLGLAAAAVCLLAGEPLRSEMQIRPEAICGFLLALHIYFTVDFIACAYYRARSPVIPGILTAVTAGALAAVKPSFAFMALVPLLPLGLFFFQRDRVRQKLQIAAGGVAGAVALFLPEYFFARNDVVAHGFVPTELFVVHADLIRDQLARELETNATLPYDREWVRDVQQQLSVEIARSRAAEPTHYPVFGFCPDYLMYEKTSINVTLAEQFGARVEELWRFYRFAYWRVWTQRPGAMLGKIARQMALFYKPICPAYDRAKSMVLTSWYTLTISNLNGPKERRVWMDYSRAVEYMRRVRPLAERAPVIEQSRVLRGVLTLLAGAYLPLLVASLALGLAALVRPEPLDRRWLCALTIFLFLYNGAACLEVAVVNSLEVPRYSTVQFYPTLLSEFLALWLVLETLGRWIAGRSQSVAREQ